MIQVQKLGGTDPLEFQVTVTEGGGKTEHRVTMSPSYHRKLTGDKLSPEDFLDAAFRFLLDREPKESILSAFDVTVISRYFPNFEREIGRYLKNSGGGS